MYIICENYKTCPNKDIFDCKYRIPRHINIDDFDPNYKEQCEYDKKVKRLNEGRRIVHDIELTPFQAQMYQASLKDK